MELVRHLPLRRIATGIVFWGIAEPLYHLMDSGVFEVLGIKPKTEQGGDVAMVTTYIHWTFIPYAMYGICGLGIAYAAYNMNLPYKVSSTLYPIAGKSINGFTGAVVDGICLLAIAGGVAALVADLLLGHLACLRAAHRHVPRPARQGTYNPPVHADEPNGSGALRAALVFRIRRRCYPLGN